MRMVGRARDLLTAGDGTAAIVASGSLRAGIEPDRTIADIAVEPVRPGIDTLVGARGGGGLRAAIDAAVPDDRRRHTPLALLLDDIAGASLVGGFAWSRQRDEANAARGGGAPAAADTRVRPPGLTRQMAGICAGFRPGSGALKADGTVSALEHNVAAVPPLTDPADPLGWHLLDPLEAVGFRRARRMDVWQEGGEFRIDAHFRDSCSDPGLGEVGVHEYRLVASVDLESQIVTSLVATPLVLPFAECPAASPNVAWLVGEPLAALRSRVLEVLRGPDCCTHLNDALRALADTAVLLELVGLS